MLLRKGEFEVLFGAKFLERAICGVPTAMISNLEGKPVGAAAADAHGHVVTRAALDWRPLRTNAPPTRRGDDEGVQTHGVQMSLLS